MIAMHRMDDVDAC